MSLLLLLLACPEPPVDPDGDGFDATEDCNNLDGAIFPGQDEACDAIDNDCDGEVDEATTATPLGYWDDDGDGFGAASRGVPICTLPAGWVRESGDCAEADPTAHPLAAEACDGVDDDCDGLVDDACRAAPTGEATLASRDFEVLRQCTIAEGSETLTLADATGDGLADLVAIEPFCGAHPTLKVFPGPLAPTSDLWQAEVEVEVELAPLTPGSSAVLLGIDVGVDATGDELPDLVTLSGMGEAEDPFVVRLYAWRSEGVLVERLRVRSGGTDFTQTVAASATLLPGEPGLVVLSVEGSTLAGTASHTWVASADASGEVELADLGTLAANEDGASSAVQAQRVGDLDGDGLPELVRVLPAGVEWFSAPIDPAAVGTPSSGVLRLDSGLGARAVTAVTSLDLDGAGVDSLVAASYARAPEDRAVYRTLRTEEGLAFDLTPLFDPVPDFDVITGLQPLDANGDGHADLALSDGYRRTDDGGTGMLCLEQGPFAGRLTACVGGLRLVAGEAGRVVRGAIGAGDTNGDGFDELLVGIEPGVEASVLASGFFGGP